jgi:hypothetical protein
LALRAKPAAKSPGARRQVRLAASAALTPAAQTLGRSLSWQAARLALRSARRQVRLTASGALTLAARTLSALEGLAALGRGLAAWAASGAGLSARKTSALVGECRLVGLAAERAGSAAVGLPAWQRAELAAAGASRA